MSAIELLKQQHREVDGLFQRIKSTTGDERISLLGQVAEALTIHAALEEQYFYPFARQQGVDGLIDESFQDHAEVKQLLSEILQVKQTDPRLDELCLRLERMVTEHVSQEESALLPKVQAVANEDELVSMRDDMQQAIDNWRNKELLRMAEHQESPPPAV
ncbi:hemerythrin HHE cation binding domain-containing protein [Archangium gephyra]|uniref:Hemerythrin HHE cation binding domain-containing protein n=1 Tax=Archangium gephyra TaxID=48 RepID=A0AAC8TCK8_9BACT|nr:hemerythrin domain-containing protein [Archangium gephyra]AKJ00975.1 Regulator of cell morphogenesis and NO signaling [Archangium gephyra]REG26140.1 hemerythrin HHE cation binding domain-containing protein [Archangium gephyra]